MKIFKAFTLAEVLITLGVIGVIATMTLPSVIKHHQQQVTVQKLKKFHTIINQVVRLSEAEYGSCKTWDRAGTTQSGVLNFYNTYFAKHLKAVEVSMETVPNSNNEDADTYIVKLSDGSGFHMHNNSNTTNRLIIMRFYPDISKLKSKNYTRDSFVFQFYNTNCTVEPYTLSWNGTRGHLKTSSSYGCNKESSNKSKEYCAKLIQYDGWKISDDYPW